MTYRQPPNGDRHCLNHSSHSLPTDAGAGEGSHQHRLGWKEGRSMGGRGDVEDGGGRCVVWLGWGGGR